MPIISAITVKRPRRLRFCENCNGRVSPGNPVVRLYGYANEGDKPYRVFLCPECAEGSLDISEALNRKPRAKKA